ncbi:hypothetical protein AB0M48_35260 [Lentzea sp. NPDC051208]|uniref:NucA/NucB deoxyribonuclease domain-containing protein n=1 Tax=Lentzea sp. NPDC051208 TaxID=3154642 RepID=UPI0034376DEB
MHKRTYAAFVAAVIGMLTFTSLPASAAGEYRTIISFGAESPAARAKALADPEIVTGGSSEFLADKPNAQQALQDYIKGPKPAKQVSQAHELLQQPAEVSAAADAITPSPVSVNDCRAKFGEEPGAPKYWYRDRFNSCMGASIEIKNVYCPSPTTCINMGAVTYRLIIVGHGTRGVTPEGYRVMSFQWFTDNGDTYGGNPPPMYESIYNGLNCKTFSVNRCGFDRAYGMATVAELHAGWTSDVLTMTERNTLNDPTNNPDDKMYYELNYTIRGGMGQIDGPVQKLRSDRADYVNKGGFVFFDQESWIEFTYGKGMDEQVRHIDDAQNRIASTKPGDPLTKTAGGRNSGHALTRMSPKYEKQRYDRNNYVALLTCKQHWGEDYATNDPSGPRECDEYPFRSTYEGAAWTEYDGGVGIWSYSGRPIAASHNSAGGNALSLFYLKDNIVHGDQFWVEVKGADD